MILEDLSNLIIDYCKKNSISKIYICGNGASGKTTLSKTICEKAKNYGYVNMISTDDFIVDTELRNNANASWNDNGNIRVGRYTSCFKNSYFLKNIEEIFYNLDNGNDYYYLPKKEDVRLLKSKNFITIVEGIGTAFIDMKEENTLRLFIQCSDDIELERRKSKKGNSLEQTDEQINKLFEARNSQFVSNVLPHINKFNVILESDKDFSFRIVKGIL